MRGVVEHVDGRNVLEVLQRGEYRLQVVVGTAVPLVVIDGQLAERVHARLELRLETGTKTQMRRKRAGALFGDLSRRDADWGSRVDHGRAQHHHVRADRSEVPDAARSAAVDVDVQCWNEPHGDVISRARQPRRLAGAGDTDGREGS